MPRAEVFIDSNDRFEDDPEELPFWTLPHNEYGYNQLEAVIKEDGWLYYEEKKVVDWKLIRSYYRYTFTEEKEYMDYYWFFHEEKKHDADDCDDIPCFVGQPFMFNNVPITDAHICITVYGTQEERKRIRGGCSEVKNPYE